MPAVDLPPAIKEYNRKKREPAPKQFGGPLAWIVFLLRRLRS